MPSVGFLESPSWPEFLVGSSTVFLATVLGDLRDHPRGQTLSGAVWMETVFPSLLPPHPHLKWVGLCSSSGNAALEARWFLFSTLSKPAVYIAFLPKSWCTCMREFLDLHPDKIHFTPFYHYFMISFLCSLFTQVMVHMPESFYISCYNLDTICFTPFLSLYHECFSILMSSYNHIYTGSIPVQNRCLDWCAFVCLIKWYFIILIFPLLNTAIFSFSILSLLSSVAQSCPTLCHPMNRSTPGLPVHHQLPELTQTHVHWVDDAIQPSHPHPLLLLPSIFPSIRVFSNESALRIRWPKYWSFSFSISPSNEHPGLISFRIDWLDLLAVRDSLESSPIPQFKSINSSALNFVYSPTLTSIHDHWKNRSLD